MEGWKDGRMEGWKEGRGAKNAGERGASVCLSVRPTVRLSVRLPARLSVCLPAAFRLWALKSPKAEQCHEQSRLLLLRRRSIIREGGRVTFSFFSLFGEGQNCSPGDNNKAARVSSLACPLFHLVTRRRRGRMETVTQGRRERDSLAPGTFTPPSHLPRQPRGLKP